MKTTRPNEFRRGVIGSMGLVGRVASPRSEPAVAATVRAAVVK